MVRFVAKGSRGSGDVLRAALPSFLGLLEAYPEARWGRLGARWCHTLPPAKPLQAFPFAHRDKGRGSLPQPSYHAYPRSGFHS